MCQVSRVDPHSLTPTPPTPHPGFAVILKKGTNNPSVAEATKNAGM